MGRTKIKPTLDPTTRAFCERETVRLLPLIEALARRCKLPLPIEDLVQEGAKAVFEALPRFDASRGAKPESWLQLRILGAFADYARQFGRLTQGGPRGRTERVISLQSFRYETDSGKEQTLEQALIPDPPPPRADWGRLLRGFNRRELLMVLEYFVHGRTMKQIAADLSISESRVSQWMTEILGRLRRLEASEGRVSEALSA